MNGNYGQGGYIPRSMMMSRMGGIPMMGMAAPPIHMQHQQMAMAHAYHNMAAAAYAQHPDMGRHVALEEEWEAERERPRRGDRDRDRSRDRDRDRDRRPDRRDERNDRVDRDRDRESRRRDDRDSRREQRDRDRGRDRESSRSSRDRSRSRDKDRGERDRDERYDREERYDRDERYDVDDRYEREGREGQERYDREGHRRSSEKDDGVSSRWMSATPSNTLLLRNLALNLTESDISAEFKSAGIPIREVRLMKHKVTGASRGFAFVEFATTTDAQHWMETNQGAMTIQGIHYVPMVYSAPRLSDAGRMVDPSGRTDWICSKCNAHNFKRRDFCFKCDVPREESERTVAAVMEDGSEHVGINPCNTLLLRGLDALTTEETITNQLSEITGMPVKNVKVIRDDLTNTSKGYAFVELHSLADSQEVLGGVTKRSAPLEIDGKAIIVTYAKNTFSTTLATLRSAASQSSRSQAPPPPRISPKEAKTTNSAAAVAQAAIISAQQQKYHQSEHGSHHHHHKSSKYSSSRKATAAALNAQEQAQWSTQNDYSQSYTQSYQYPPPDVSTYQYDETSGYYYDSSTGLYYDPNTQYYWNQETQQFMYWEPSTYTYQVAPNQAEITQNTAQSSQQQLPPPSQTQNQQGEEAVTTKKEKEKKEKVKMAKKIAKDMEKWAKSMNKTKNKSGPSTLAQPQPVLSEPIYTEPSSLRPSTADAGYAMLSGLSKNNTLMPPPSAVSPEHGSGSGGGLVASYGGDSDEEEVEETLDLDKLIDLTKMACLLCKRQFPNKDVLSKHIQLSDLHKKNVDELVARQSNPTYRDRAKERRKKVGSTPPMGRSR